VLLSFHSFTFAPRHNTRHNPLSRKYPGLLPPPTTPNNHGNITVSPQAKTIEIFPLSPSKKPRKYTYFRDFFWPPSWRTYSTIAPVPLSVSLGRNVINSNVCVYHKVSRLCVVLQKYSWCAVLGHFELTHTHAELWSWTF